MMNWYEKFHINYSGVNRPTA